MADSPPAVVDEVPGELLPLETGVDKPSTLATGVGDEVPPEDSGPSWLQPGFEVPTKED